MTTLFTTTGEILIDFTPVVQEGTTVGFQMHAGGSPLNVAIALARLGARVEFAGKVSTDFFGRFLAATLNGEGVGTRFLARSPAPTTLAFVTLEGGEPSFSFYGRGAADTLLQPADVSKEVSQTAFLHFGSISLLHAPTSTTILDLVERLRGRAVLSFDPNIRPGLVDDEPAYRRLLDRAFRASDIIKLSRNDAAWLMPDRPVETAAAALLERGPVLAVVTLGAQGCYAASRSLQRRIPAPEVRVVDSVGAGDAFTAGLLVRLEEQSISSRAGLELLTEPVLDGALRFAAAAATLSCARAGSNPPRREEVASLLAG